MIHETGPAIEINLYVQCGGASGRPVDLLLTEQRVATAFTARLQHWVPPFIRALRPRAQVHGVSLYHLCGILDCDVMHQGSYLLCQIDDVTLCKNRKYPYPYSSCARRQANYVSEMSNDSIRVFHARLFHQSSRGFRGKDHEGDHEGVPPDRRLKRPQRVHSCFLQVSVRTTVITHPSRRLWTGALHHPQIPSPSVRKTKHPSGSPYYTISFPLPFLFLLYLLLSRLS